MRPRAIAKRDGSRDRGGKSMRCMLRAITALVAGAIWLSLSGPASAQAAVKPWRVGILWHAGNLQEEAIMFGPLAAGLRELGYVEGSNIVFEHTFVDEKYDLFDARARDLVDRKVALIVASLARAAVPAPRLTKTIPIVLV